jgi:hypothetical protein
LHGIGFITSVFTCGCSSPLCPGRARAINGC